MPHTAALVPRRFRPSPPAAEHPLQVILRRMPTRHGASLRAHSRLRRLRPAALLAAVATLGGAIAGGAALRRRRRSGGDAPQATGDRTPNGVSTSWAASAPQPQPVGDDVAATPVHTAPFTPPTSADDD